ncbi:uncharacterized protein F4822DRAFT_441925 [Hypoxylon trugodes]|uniref:uncharacterized protein n=1 Tax=Hypoxylon trugodes TaxID=326681 RepID=UPI002199614C|nr:uncharacterized protein F4822DRAFT_441925 [Hypoxylon trugodes]KAI1390617.1 hypothetical protein F4822DRAFT_441925 [Hypoxylon trugodes]
MDPFTALGIAANIASFIQMTYGIISNAYEASQSISGMIREDDQLQFVVKQLKMFSESLVSTKPALQLTNAETAMDAVARKCHSLSSKLLEILNRTYEGTVDQHSFRRSAVVTLKSKWRDAEKRELKKRIDECRELFHLQLTAMMGTDIIKSLNELTNTGKANEDTLITLQGHVISLERGVTLYKIGGEATNQLANILQLSTNALNSARSQQILQSLAVSESHGRYENVAKAHLETFEWIFEENSNKSPKALKGNRTFTDWLKSGGGIPYRRETGAPVQLHLEDDSLSNAFNLLVENLMRCHGRCFFIAIDGLDEFQETPNEGFKELIKLILSWTEKAPTQLKLCVSSREHTVFLDKFAGTQNLRLQDLTVNDINKFVKEKLESNYNFLKLEHQTGGTAGLISQVTEESSGVFLWAASVVKLLDEACDNGDTLEQLQRKVKFLPKEIKYLFRQLFNFIDEFDKAESARTFAFVFTLLENAENMGPSLFRYSLLDDYNADPLFASRADFRDRRILATDVNSVNQRIERARKQLYKRSQGLLEVVTLSEIPGCGSGASLLAPLLQRIALVHRSIPEFLEEDAVSKDLMAKGEGFDVLGAICQTFVGETASFNLDRWHFGDNPLCWELVDIVSAVSKANSITLQRGCIPRTGSTLSVAHCAAFYGLYEFFTSWDDSVDCPFNRDIQNGCLLLFALCKIDEADAKAKDNLLTIINWLLRRGCSPNRAIIIREDKGLKLPTLEFSNATIWLYLAYKAIVVPAAFDAVEIFLEYGAHPGISFIAGEGPREWLKIVGTATPVVAGKSTISAWASEIRQHGYECDSESKFFRFLFSYGKLAALKQVIEHMNPPNALRLLDLIDRNMATPQPVLDASSSCLDNAPIAPLPEQTAGEEAPINKLEKTNYGVGMKPDLEVSGGYTAMDGLKRVITNPLATFVLGIILSYCVLICVPKHVHSID